MALGHSMEFYSNCAPMYGFLCCFNMALGHNVELYSNCAPIFLICGAHDLFRNELNPNYVKSTMKLHENGI